MSAKNLPHVVANEEAADWFRSRLRKRAVVRSQNPIVLNDLSEPEPDIVLAKPPKQNYRSHHPTPPEIFAVMEIADSGLQFDRKYKSLIYARAGIVQYLLLNLRARELEDYREPSADGYRSKRTYTAEQSFDLATFPGVTIAVKDSLPPE